MGTKAVRTLLLLILAALAVFRLGAEDLLKASVENADLQSLQMMAQAYRLDSSDDENQLRADIMAFLASAYWGSAEQAFMEHGSDALSAVTEEEAVSPGRAAGDGGSPETDSMQKEAQYTLQIKNALSVSVSESLIVLDGDVSLSFSAQGQGEKTLSADRVIIDLDNKLLTAMGNASFLDGSEDPASRSLIGDAVSYSWKTMQVRLTGGVMSSKRVNNEGQSVEFYAEGSEISYMGEEDAVVFNHGTIATSVKDPYWSIESDKIALLGGGDLFVTGASLRLGRVPVLWLPVFFYPGTRLVFNPAIGITSDRGMFLNTTTEIYGVYATAGLGKGSSSFSTLLRSEDDGEMVNDGMIYRQLEPGEKLGSLESWARASGSYMAFMADVYRENGLFVGLQTQNFFLDKKIEIGGFMGLATDFSASAPHLRYFENISGRIELDFAKLDFSLPFYSDPDVARIYGNRLDAFSMDALLGARQTFPSSFSSVDSFKWVLKGSADIPVDGLGPYVRRLSINSLNVLVDYAYSYANKRYEIKSAAVPYFNTTMSGTLIDVLSSHDVESKASYEDSFARKLQEEAEAAVAGAENAGAPDSEAFAGLSPYITSLSTEKRSYSDSFSLGYKWNQSFSNEAKGAALSSSDVYYKTDADINLKTSLGDRVFYLSESLMPYFEHSESSAGSSSGKLASRLQAKLPFLGLTYNMNWRLFSFTGSKGVVTDSQWLDWDALSVSVHDISLAYPAGSFEFSAKQTLPPLRQTLTPQITYRQGSLAATISQRFAEGGEIALEPTLLTGSLAISKPLLSADLTSSYDFSAIDSGWDSHELKQTMNLYFWKDGLCFSDSLKMTGPFLLKSLDLRLSYKKNLVSLRLDGSETPAGKWNVGLSQLETVLDVSRLTFSFWKGRVNARASLNFDLLYDFHNRYASSLKASLDLTFCIAEFMDLKFSVASENNSFYRYFEDDRFVFGNVISDLAKSFDFFGDGRLDTGFNLSKMELELVHYMKDWDFHCKYNARVVLSDGSWVWRQSASFYVKWRAIPDINMSRSKEWDN